MKETGWKKTAGNGSDGKRTEGKKSFGRGEKTTGFSKNSAKVGVNGEKQGKSARKVSGVEDKWVTHGDRKRNVGEKDGQKTFGRYEAEADAVPRAADGAGDSDS